MTCGDKKSCERRRRTEENEAPDQENDGIDRLGALPDDILHHIMSFLYTKDAAATCVLSTRWRNLFSSIPVLHLNINGLPDPVLESDDSDEEFFESLSIGYKVILQRNRAPIRKLRVWVYRLVERFQLAIDFFISAALQCDVKELDIVVSHNATGRLFPLEIFTYKTLVTVKLSWQVNLVVPSSVFLPNLKVLHLTGPMGVVDENCFPRLIRGCPSLEELYLVLHRLSVMIEVVDLSSPSLKKLRLTSLGGRYNYVIDCNSLEYLEVSGFGNHMFMLNVPNLKDLEYEIDAQRVTFIQELKSLVRATISSAQLDAEGTESQQAFDLVNRLQSVQSLDLCHHSLQALHYSRHLLPTYENLTALVIKAPWDDDFDHRNLWTMLPALLQRAPNLEVLIFHKVFRNDFSGTKEFKCILAEAIPICFVERLREIEIREFYGEEYEIKLVQYFLQNGKSLKKMTLCGVRQQSNTLSDAWNKILLFNKSSEVCQIVFKETIWMRS